MSRITTMAPHSRSSPADIRHESVGLIAECDVVRGETGWEARTDEPWLRLSVNASEFAGCWIELIYDLGLTDAVTRPLLRSVVADGHQDQILPGAVLGRAIWLGRIPNGTIAILVSPVNSPGPFAFRIVSARILSRRQLVSRGIGMRPKYVMLGLGHEFFGNDLESERCFRRALHSTPIRIHRRWAEPRRRAPEWDGFDALPTKAVEGPHIRVVATDRNGLFLERLRSWLHAQPWPYWSLAAPMSDPSPDVVAFPPEARLAECLTDLRPRDFVIIVQPQDNWAPETLGAVGVASLSDDSDVYYGDEEIIDRGLKLKPDWSSILARFADLIGRAWVARAEWARRVIGNLRVTEAAATPLPVNAGVRAAHLRRVLLRSRIPEPIKTRDAVRPSPPPATGLPCTTIVIPTRDRVDLLRSCVKSLLRDGGRMDWEAILVDNGSKEPEASAYLREVVRDSRFRVLERPGPFNFSALCNAGAAEARAPNLIFLNNDIVALSPDWLDLLVGWTALPSVGAVGAKLIYPDGRLQHGGVVIGVDGHATHFERFGRPDEPGFFDRLNVPHEVSAVTGACLAVEKTKFDAVGGFDAINLPVEFSDIDLCLRLAERGWTTLVEPAARLIHHEAATRKVWRSQEQRYAGQVAYFKERWRARLRDDPYFNPALSLDWHTAALG